MEKNERFISITHSKELYGIAILLMICHHMFGFPERINGTYITFFMHKGTPVITILAGGCKLCVAMYAFLSGYGMITKIGTTNPIAVIKKGYQVIFQHLKKFYMVYWLIFAIFIGYGFLTGRRAFQAKEFFYNLLGIAHSYNGEWWYVWQYVRMLLLFPLFACVIVCFSEKIKKGRYVLWLALVLLLEVAAVLTSLKTPFWVYTFCFFNGMIISYGKVDVCLYRMAAHPATAVLIGTVLSCAVFLARLTIAGGGQYEFIVGPLFIYGCLLILQGKWLVSINRLLNEIGKYSVYMWLIHTFFIYYYFQKIVFAFKYAFIIYIATVIILVFTSILIDYISDWVNRKILWW